MIDTKIIQKLREETGAPIIDIKNSLEESRGDIQKAKEILRKKGMLKVAAKAARRPREGIIYSYIHANGRIGAMVELLCETDFVARNEEFKELAHDLAMQIAATCPVYISREDIADEVMEKEKELASREFEGKGASIIEKAVQGKLEKWFSEVCLLNQPFIKNEDITVKELIEQKIAKLGENIEVKRFCRFSLGTGAHLCE